MASSGQPVAQRSNSGVLKNHVFDSTWGAAHADAALLVSFEGSQDYSNAAAATRAAVLVSVSDGPNVKSTSEDAFVKAARAHASRDPWPAPVVSALSVQSGRPGAGLEPNLAATVEAILLTLSARGTAKFSDKLERADRRMADAVLAALQPREATWVHEATWLPSSGAAMTSSATLGCQADDECVFVPTRLFGHDGLVTSREASIREEGRKTSATRSPVPPRSEAPAPVHPEGSTDARAINGLKRPEYFLPVRGSSNPTDKVIGNRYTNKRLANGPGVSPKLIELGKNAPTRDARELFKQQKEKVVTSKRYVMQAPDAQDERKDGGAGVEKNFDPAESGVVGAAVDDRAVSQAPGEREGAEIEKHKKAEAIKQRKVAEERAQEEMRMANPYYRKRKLLEAKRKKQAEEELEKKRLFDARKAARGAAAKAKGKKVLSKKAKAQLAKRGRRATAEERRREKYDIARDSDNSESEERAYIPGRGPDTVDSNSDEAEDVSDMRKDYSGKRRRLSPTAPRETRSRRKQIEASGGERGAEDFEASRRFPASGGDDAGQYEPAPSHLGANATAQPFKSPEIMDGGVSQLRPVYPGDDNSRAHAMIAQQGTQLYHVADHTSGTSMVSLGTGNGGLPAARHDPLPHSRQRRPPEPAARGSGGQTGDSPDKHGVAMKAIGNFFQEAGNRGIRGNGRSRIPACTDANAVWGEGGTAAAGKVEDNVIVPEEAGNREADANMALVLRESGNKLIADGSPEWLTIRDFFRGSDHMFGRARSGEIRFTLDATKWDDVGQAFIDLKLVLGVTVTRNISTRNWRVTKVPAREAY